MNTYVSVEAYDVPSNWNMSYWIKVVLATVAVTVAVNVVSLIPIMCMVLIGVPETYIVLVLFVVVAPLVEEGAKSIIIRSKKKIWMAALFGMIIVELVLYVVIGGQGLLVRLLPLCMHLTTMLIILHCKPLKGFAIGVIIHASFNVGAIIIATY